MSVSMISPGLFGRPLRVRGLKVFRLAPALALLLCASLLLALEAPSKPFLDKNSFFLSSAGFRVQLANDAMGRKALHALPPHRFVTHQVGDQVRYFYAEPKYCDCIFVGTPAAYEAYRDMLRQPLQQPDDVAPDYTTQATALLDGPPVWLNTLDEPDTLAEFFRDYY
jgi:hypothetical protein